MATNKKAVKKTATKAAKPEKKAPKKAATASKPAPKKAAAKPKPVAAKKQVAKPAPPKKAAAKKAEVKKPAKAAPVKKVASKPAPVVKAVPAKKAAPAQKPAKEQKAVQKPVVEQKAVQQPVAPAKPAKTKEKPKAEPAKPVVIPKLSTNVARKYEPEFTQSVLDKPAQQNGPMMRYSDAELTEFRELIQRKLEAAKKELNYLQGLITRKDDMGGDESENRYMTMEDGSISMEREQLAQMASRQIQYIDHLEKAMMRIENKTYGICRVTGQLIDKARLRAVPHATLSIEAKMGFSKNPNIQ